MAIDLICYSTLLHEDVKKKIDELRSSFPQYFDDAFLLYYGRSIQQLSTDIVDDKEIAAREYSNETHRAIVAGYDIDAQSYFMCTLNDKSRIDKMNKVVREITHSFGTDNILILHNGEKQFGTNIQNKSS